MGPARACALLSSVQTAVPSLPRTMQPGRVAQAGLCQSARHTPFPLLASARSRRLPAPAPPVLGAMRSSTEPVWVMDAHGRRASSVSLPHQPAWLCQPRSAPSEGCRTAPHSSALPQAQVPLTLQKGAFFSPALPPQDCTCPERLQFSILHKDRLPGTLADTLGLFCP